MAIMGQNSETQPASLHSTTVETIVTSDRMGRIPEEVRQSITAWVCVAGAAYGLLLCGIGTVLNLVLWLIALGSNNPQPTMWLVQIAITFSLTAIVAIFGGAIYAGIAALITLPICFLFIRSMRLSASVVWIGACCGGIVAFVSMTPLLFGTPLIESGKLGVTETLIVALGPGLSTIVGQVGGSWGAYRAVRRSTIKVLRAAMNGEDGAIDDTAIEMPVGGGISLQFRIAHLLWISVWFSLLLTLIRFSGARFEVVLPVFFGWLFFQALTLIAGATLARWWQRHRKSRRAARRST